MNIDAGLMNPLEYFNLKAAIVGSVTLTTMTDMVNASYSMMAEKSTWILAIMNDI